jgi:hypothetical protein
LDQVCIYLLGEWINLENIGALIQHHETAFDDPDRTATAEWNLRGLRQTNMDSVTYYAEPMRYAPDTTWNNAAKHSELRAGLCSELLDRLVTVDEPEDWNDFIARYKKADRKLRALGEGNKNTNLNRMTSIRSGPTVPTAQSTTTTAMGTYPVPMYLSASKRHLTDEERAIRIREDHCL